MAILMILVYFVTKKRKSTKRVITINTKLLIWTPNKQSTLVAFKENSLELLQRLNFDIYLISIVHDDLEQVRIQELFSRFDYKLLFCDTQQGMISICKHLNPTLHLDNNFDILKEIGRGIFVGKSRENIMQCETIKDLLPLVNKY